jgi:hypothetical protein
MNVLGSVQGPTGKMMDILSENRKKEYSKSVTELLSLEEKRFVQGISYFINKTIFQKLKNT